MVRGVNKAARKDRQERDEKGVLEIEFAKGSGAANLPDHARKLGVAWVMEMRKWFAGHIIRRDNHSVDFEGKNLLNLKPCINWVMELELTKDEMQSIDEGVDAMVVEHEAALGLFTEVSVICRKMSELAPLAGGLFVGALWPPSAALTRSTLRPSGVVSAGAIGGESLLGCGSVGDTQLFLRCESSSARMAPIELVRKCATRTDYPSPPGVLCFCQAYVHPPSFRRTTTEASPLPNHGRLVGKSFHKAEGIGHDSVAPSW